MRELYSLITGHDSHFPFSWRRNYSRFATACIGAADFVTRKDSGPLAPFASLGSMRPAAVHWPGQLSPPPWFFLKNSGTGA
jgi:hypothetical protein